MPRLFMVFVLASMALAACHKTTTPEDPCAKVQRITADFTTQEGFWYFLSPERRYSTDTLSDNVVRFTALDSTAQRYEWYIGADVITRRSFDMTFPPTFALKPYTSVPITLKVYKRASECSSSPADTVRTQTKWITFINECESLMNGRFEGYIDNSTSKRVIEINLCDIDWQNRGVSISNLVEDCKALFGTWIGGYKILTFASGGCLGLVGWARIGSNANEIIIDYETNENGFQQPAVKHRFVGQRKP